MCFKNLPIDFDIHGRPRLKGDWDDARPEPPLSGDRLARALERGADLRDFDVDPVTRVAGALSFHSVVDLESREVVDARTEATLFRGYEIILKGRQPLDAIHISSRACGVCGGVHAICSAMALEMAFGVSPPPLALVARNLGEGAELLYDHSLHLFLLAGPDYSEPVVRATTPSLWERARSAPAPGADRHGLRTIADIMRGLTPLKGGLYLEALEVTRDAREVASLMLGKYPHPSTIYPGGLGIEADESIFNRVLGRIIRLLDFTKRAVGIWDDLVDFFLEAVPEYEQVGRGRCNLISTGMWDDPEAYDARYETADDWGARRLATPGIVMDGRLRTTRLRDITLGIEEFVDHSYYEHWKGDRHTSDPDGAPLSPYHPWNKETLPAPSGRSWKEKYTWSTAPRWDREPMESGPLARQWISSVAGALDNPFIRSTQTGLEVDLPPSELPAVTLRWSIPTYPNALERNRARAFHLAYTGMAAYTYLLKAFDLVRRGETAMSTSYSIPSGQRRGVGFWEAGRGTLTHFVELDGGKIRNYQIITPSTWMASPRDPFGGPGPYEEAVMATPLLEEITDPDAFTGIDILRTIRSFDPCMPCTVHMDTGQRTRSVDATSCACGVTG